LKQTVEIGKILKRAAGLSTGWVKVSAVQNAQIRCRALFSAMDAMKLIGVEHDISERVDGPREGIDRIVVTALRMGELRNHPAVVRLRNSMLEGR
jgi:hypothetical protein